MFNKNFEDIGFEDIENLTTQGIVENQNLEYKREIWGLSDGDKKEMLKDIASLANKYGGYIIIGIEEDGDGKAVSVVNVENAESGRDRIASTVFANIQPRLPLKIKVLTKEEVNIIVINIPNSFRKPHIITFQGLNQFWVRHDRQKMLMHINEIEEAFVSMVNINKNIELFFLERKKEVVQEIGNKPMLVIGIYPITSDREMIDVSDAQLREYLKKPPVIRSMGANFEFTYSVAKPSFHGLSIGGGDDYRTKVELYRNGYLEGQVNLSHFLNRATDRYGHPDEAGGQIMINWAIVELLYSLSKQAKQIYSYLGYDGQLFVNCNFFNIKDLGLEKYKPGSVGGFEDLARWGKVNLEIPPLVFTEIDDFKITKTISDRIWQSFGFEQEPFFNGRDFKVEHN